MLQLLVALFTSSFAGAAPSAVGMCFELPCPPHMAQIYQGYMASHTSFERKSQAYSGTCFHIHPNLREDIAHHGLMLLETTADGMGLTFSGLFSFFTRTNPYAGQTVGELQAMMNQRQARKHTVQMPNAEEAFVEIPSSNGSNFYWMRLDGQKAYLMSQWTFTNSAADVRIFCELTEAAAP